MEDALIDKVRVDVEGEFFSFDVETVAKEYNLKEAFGVS